MFELIKKLDLLSCEQTPLWGKMSAQHMVEHLALTLQVSNGKLTVECINAPEKLATLRKILLSERPLPKGFINPVIGEGLFELKYNSLEESILALKNEVVDYEKFFEANSSVLLIHPIFGPSNKSEWDIFHRKHFTHHLKQFGLL